MGGSEKTLINISNQLAKLENITVKVFNNTKNKITINNVEWNNLINIKDATVPDYLICMSDANLLSLIYCKNKFLLSLTCFFHKISTGVLLVVLATYHLLKEKGSKSALKNFFPVTIQDLRSGRFIHLHTFHIELIRENQNNAANRF